MYLSDIASEAYYSGGRAARDNLPALNVGLGIGSMHGSLHDADSLPGSAGERRYRTSPPAPPTSIPLDDNFDAFTTEVPTEWAVGDGHQHPEYDESVSGYRNYVAEMERMLSGQMENAARAQERQHQQFLAQQEQYQQRSQHQHQQQTQNGTRLRRSNTSVSWSVRGSSSRTGEGGGERGGRRSLSMAPQQPSPLHESSLSPSPPPENARQVTGKKGKIELVEQRILEDSPARTISLWRERVAQSSVGLGGPGEAASASVDELETQSDADGPGLGCSHHGPSAARVRGHVHRRVPSSSTAASDVRLRRVASEHARYMSSVDGSGTRHGSVRGTGTENGKGGRATYERSEYIVSYQATKGGMPKETLFSPRSQVRELKTPSSPTLSRTFERSPPSPTLRRHAPRKSLDRSEYMMSYPQTPPLTDSQASSSSPRPKGNNQKHASPMHDSFRDAPEEGSMFRSVSTSSVDIILSSCDPSLLHIAPVLYDLGIKRVDHLRAVARLSEETRDREVKEQALKRGVTVVEWAIFLDRLQSL